MTSWFISDIHIKDINERSSITLLRFLRSLLNKEMPATHLFFVGDIFDLWISNSAFFLHKYKDFIDLVVSLKSQGVEVYYFEGNHDIHVKHFWQEQLGIPTFTDEHYFKIGGKNIRVEHGDMINDEEVNYRKLRSFLRHPVTEKFLALTPGNVIAEVGDLASAISRKRTAGMRQSQHEKMRTMIRNYAERIYLEKPFDYLITGHLHVQDEYSFAQNKAVSINLGSWFEGPKALRIDKSGHQFISIE